MRPPTPLERAAVQAAAFLLTRTALTLFGRRRPGVTSEPWFQEVIDHRSFTADDEARWRRQHGASNPEAN